jgi:mannose-1-phosphate guanylyltransferase/mannose-6-phosphate isomerase
LTGEGWDGGDRALTVESFVEKPDPETALRYLKDGGYYWNSGMFVLKASVWINALERFRPDIAQATRAAWARHSNDAKFIRPGKEEFAGIPTDSIDYAVMEKCPGNGIDIRMVQLTAGWNDIGAWDAVWQVSSKDTAGNATHGDVMITDSSNTLVHATNRLVSLVGIENVVVIETPDAVLVAHRTRCQEVRKIVTALEASKREEHALHRKVHRPWGSYDSIDSGDRFRVKRIVVNPGASLSLQMHHHRAEHWIVVRGTARVTRGIEVFLLSENESTYIPIGTHHRLENPGKVPLEMVEVQSGAYLGEDDIVRFEDSYGRNHLQ